MEKMNHEVIGEVKLGFSVVTNSRGKRTFRVEVTKPNGDIEVVNDTTMRFAMEDMAELAKDAFETIWNSILDAEELAEAEAEEEEDTTSAEVAELAFRNAFGDATESLERLTVRPTSPSKGF